MQINNNQHTNFKAVTITKPALEELSRRMPAGKFTIGIEDFKNKYKDYATTLKIDVYNKNNPRLDATIYCKKNGREDLIHFMENQFSYLLDLNPEKFLKKAAKEMEKMENKINIEI